MGSIIIVIGFYSVMWGKAKEVKVSQSREVGFADSANERAPLLANKDEELEA